MQTSNNTILNRLDLLIFHNYFCFYIDICFIYLAISTLISGIDPFLQCIRAQSVFVQSQWIVDEFVGGLNSRRINGNVFVDNAFSSRCQMRVIDVRLCWLAIRKHNRIDFDQMLHSVQSLIIFRDVFDDGDLALLKEWT